MRRLSALAFLVGCIGCRDLGQRVSGPAPTLTVIARDFSFEGPDSIAAGLTTLRLINLGHWNHQALLFKVPSGHSAAEVREALSKGAEPGWAILPVGGPGPTASGDTTNATMILEPGTYTIICFFIGGGAPHFVAGMVKDFRVTGSVPAGTREPEPDVTIELKDYGFGISRPPTPGPTRLGVTNRGPQDHELMIFRLLVPHDSTGLTEWLAGRRPEAPMMRAVGGFSGLPAGGHGTTDIVFAPGTYLLFCDTPDETDGRPHRSHGMWQVLRVE